MEQILVYMTFPEEKTATRIGRALLEQRLVACVNILPRVESMYWWEGEIQREPRWLRWPKPTRPCSNRSRLAFWACILMKYLVSWQWPWTKDTRPFCNGSTSRPVTVRRNDPKIS